MRETFELINQMQADGVIGKYAIGGAVGATFYLEPVTTYDLDIFFTFPESTTSSLLSPSPIYEYLKERGCSVSHEHIVIRDWPVQFLAAANSLEQDAVDHAEETDLEGVKTWVMPAEHLVAIALRKGRTKDHTRILQFLEQGAVDSQKLQTLLERHQLSSNWQAFEQRYLHGSEQV